MDDLSPLFLALLIMAALIVIAVLVAAYLLVGQLLLWLYPPIGIAYFAITGVFWWCYIFALMLTEF